MDKQSEGVGGVTVLKTQEMKAPNLLQHTYSMFGLLKDSAATSEQRYIDVTVIVFPSLRA